MVSFVNLEDKYEENRMSDLQNNNKIMKL